MTKMLKKCMSLMLSAVLVLSLIVGISVPAEADNAVEKNSLFSDADCTQSTAAYSVAINISGNSSTKYAASLSYHASTPEVVTFFDYKNHLNVVYEDTTIAEDNIIIQRYDENIQLIDTVILKERYPIFGNITYDSSGYYYVVWGQNDTDNENCTVICVSKYDYNGNYIAECEISGYESNPYSPGSYWGTQYPFHAGNCSIAVNNGVIACNYARKMYSGHQSNYVFYINCSTMERISVSNVSYCSHSFDQSCIATSDGAFLMANHGDGYYRGFGVSKISSSLSVTGTKCTFHFREGSNRDYGYNETYAQLGGLTETDNTYVLCGSSERTLSLDVAPTNKYYYGHSESRDLFVQILKKDFTSYSGANMYAVEGETRTVEGESPTDALTQLFLSGSEVDYGVIWLTDYDDEYYVNNPKILTLDDNSIFIAWEKLSYSTNTGTTYYAIINEDGTIKTNPREITGIRLPGNTSLSYNDGKIYWATSDNNGKNVNVLDVNADNNFSETTDSHIWETEYTIDKEATCDTSGIKSIHCENCDSKKDETVIPALGHNYDMKITKAATCTANGVKKYTCTMCGDIYTETIYATGHTYSTTITKATTSQNGSIVEKCSNCGTENITTIAMIKSVTLSKTSYTYTGSELKPSVTVTDNDGKTIDSKYYTVIYSNNVNVGKATVKVTFKENYIGTVTKTFDIVAENTYIASGTCGSNITWKIDSDYVLHINGSGEMQSYPYTDDYGVYYRYPTWVNYKYTSIDIDDSITSICSYAFYDNVYITEVTIPASVVSIGNCAFYNCSSLMDVYFEGNTCSIADSQRTFVNKTDSLGDYFTGTFYCSKYSDAYAYAISYGIDYQLPESECVHNAPYSKGSTAIYCKNCGSFLYFIKDVVDLDCEHNNTKIINAISETCISKGYSGDAYCNDCKKIIAVGSNIAATGHTWSDSYTVDVAATCTTAGSKSIHCANCDETKNVTTVSALGHKYTSVITKKATCTETGVKKYICEMCGDTYAESISAIGHTSESKVIENSRLATCETKGAYDEVIYCTKCGYELSRNTVTVPSLGHSYSDWYLTGNATCTTGGTESRECENCGNVEIRAVAATGHTWMDDYTVDIVPTCTTSGSRSIHCIHCDATKSVTTVSATGHNYISAVTKAATCTETGVKTYTCQNDTSHQYTEVVPAAEHSYSDWYMTGNATCTTGGTESRECENCENVETRAVAATGHTWSDSYTVDVAATCTTAGSESIHCANCDETKNVTTVSALGHKYTSVITKEATCTETGVKKYTCTICGDTYTEIIPTTGQHSYKTTITMPTCTTEGYITYTCEKCGDSYKESYNASIEHNYTTTSVSATTSTNGSVVTKCSVCGDVKSRTSIAKIKSTTLSVTSYIYDGKVKKPSVIVKDSNGKTISSKYYTVTYKNNTFVGKGTVTIKFSGNYSGVVTKTFTINPKASSISKLTSKSKGFMITWKKISSQIAGYQIQYSTSSKFTAKTTVTKTAGRTRTNLTVNKLKAKKKYYVRIRTYINVSGKTYYSAWSKVKTVTTKK